MQDVVLVHEGGHKALVSEKAEEQVGLGLLDGSGGAID